MYMYFSYMYLVIISFIYCLHVLSITVYLNLLLYYYIWTFTNISPPSGVGPKFFSLKCITVCKQHKRPISLISTILTIITAKSTLLHALRIVMLTT